MTNHATPEERDAHADRLKLADQKWAELQPTHYENADDTAKWYWTVGFVAGLKEANTVTGEPTRSDTRRCEICGGNDGVAVRVLMTGDRRVPICSPCFQVWYEFNLITPETILAKRRELETANE